MPQKQLGYQQTSPMRQYARKQPHPTPIVQATAPPEKVRRVDEWQAGQQQQQMVVKNESQKLTLTQEGISQPLNLEILDQKGQVTLPNGQKVVLVSVMEDGTFMQIKGSKYGEKVSMRLIFKRTMLESNYLALCNIILSCLSTGPSGRYII